MCCNGPLMGSVPIGGMKKNALGVQATAPEGPLEVEPLPEPDPGVGGRAAGAGSPVSPPRGRGPSLPPVGAVGTLPPVDRGLAGARFPAGRAPDGVPVQWDSGRTRYGT